MILSEQLKVACSSKNVGKIKELLDDGCEVDTPMSDKGTTALIASSNYGDLESVSLLLSRNASVDVREAGDGMTALLCACAKGYVDIVYELCSVGKSDTNLCTKHGCSPFWISAQKGNVEMMKILKEFGADIHKADLSGITPSLIAANLGHEKALECLESFGCIFLQTHVEAAERNLLVSSEERTKVMVGGNNYIKCFKSV